MDKGTQPDCHSAPHPSTWRWKVRSMTGASGGFAEGRPSCCTCSRAAAGHCHAPARRPGCTRARSQVPHKTQEREQARELL